MQENAAIPKNAAMSENATMPEKIDIPSNIPPKYRQKYADITERIIPFCEEYMDSDYSALCIHALQKLCRKKNEPMSSGKNNMWAAGIVYAIALNCNLIGNKGDLLLGRGKYKLKADDICGAFGVSKGGVAEKAKGIRKELAISQSKKEWLVPSMHDAARLRKDFDRLMRGLR